MVVSQETGQPSEPGGRSPRRRADPQRGRDIDRALTALAWTGDDGRFTATLKVQSGMALISMEGHLGRTALVACKCALDAAIRIRPAHLIIDLDRSSTDEDTAGLIALMVRSAARHGISPHLTKVPMVVRTLLAELVPAGSYSVHQSLPVALRLITGVTRPVVT